MSLLDKIKKAHLEARKSKNKNEMKFYSYILGELQKLHLSGNRNAELSDNAVVEYLTKYAKDIEKTIKETGSTEQYELELSLVKQFLPKQLSEEELRIEIEKIAAEINSKNIKEFLNKLDDKYSNQYNKGVAVKIINQVTKG